MTSVEDFNSFLIHLDQTTDEIVDSVDVIESGGSNIDERFMVEISVNGKSIKVPLNSEVHQRLVTIIKYERDDVYHVDSV